MRRYIYFVFLLCCAVNLLLTSCVRQKYVVMDMVHHNPGEAMTESKFLDPSFLKKNEYGAKVFFLFEAAQFGIDWKSFDPSLFPDTTEAGRWVAEKAEIIHKKYDAAKKEDLQVYCMLDMLVLPSLLVEKHRTELTNEQGKLDISKPYTQLCIRELMKEMFETFPQLDGLVIRTGETYLHDAPYYVGNHPVQNGMYDHITLINLLREEVCERRNKKLFYRTWDMGQLHSIPKYYLSVTDSIEPHPNLYFSIKHTMTDFWRSTITDPDMNYNIMNQNMNMGYNGMMMNQNLNDMMSHNTDNMMNNNMLNNNMMMNNQDMNMSNNMAQNINQNMNTMENMPESMNNNMNQGVNSNINTMGINMNNNFENNPNVTNNAPEVNQNMNSNDSFFIPASEQTPKFEPREVSIPKPVEPTPILNNGINSGVAPVTEPREVPSMQSSIPNPMPSVAPQMTVPTPEPMQNSISEATTGVQMGGVTPTPIPNTMPQMAGPSVIPNVNIPSAPVVEPMNQANTNNMPNNMINNVPNGVPNTMPNMNQMPQEPVNNMNGYTNNLVQGGSNFVMNGNVPNNQNNGNWNL